MTNVFELPRFVTISGPVAGQVFHLESDQATLGRDGANAIAIADPSLSRKHCIVSRVADGWTVRDLDSFNGTLVNGQRISEQVLADGDRITLGDTQLLFRAQREHNDRQHDIHQTTRLRLEEAVYLRRPAELPGTPRIQRDLHALVRIGTIVTGIRTRDALERELVDAAFEALDAAEAMLLRIEPGTADRRVVARRAADPDVETPLSRTAIEHAVSTGEAILAHGPMTTGPLRDAPSVASADLSSLLAVPMMGDAGVVEAVLYLVTHDPRGAFDQLHLELLTALAGIGSVALRNVSRLESLQAEADAMKRELGISHEMIGTSPAMQAVYEFIKKVAPSDTTVLIQGETGTGKELAARALHTNSRRADRPFVAINCAALAETLLESELFGHERGAFTGAVMTKRGKLEVADHGTLFLDEVGELSAATQSKLLRFLQEREFERLGGTRQLKVDIRVVSATNRDLEREVAEGRFRRDLLYRLNVVTLEMPPLRSRRQDVPLIAAHVATGVASRLGRRLVTWSPAVAKCLAAYDWPGNVRELQNAVERAIVLSDGPEIVLDDLPEALIDKSAASESVGSTFHAAIAEAKRRVVRAALAETGGKVTEAARSLGLHPNYLSRLVGILNLREPPGAVSPKGG